MKIAYRLAVFDSRTDELLETHEIPTGLITEIKQIAQIPADDDGAGDYPLTEAQSYIFARKLQIKHHLKSVNCLIEPYPNEVRAAHKK